MDGLADLEAWNAGVRWVTEQDDVERVVDLYPLFDRRAHVLRTGRCDCGPSAGAADLFEDPGEDYVVFVHRAWDGREL